MPKTIYITEKQKKAIAAQDQVHNKVNAGIMDAVCGICESEPKCYLGTEGGNNDYFHIVTEGKENKFNYRPYIKSLLNFFKDNTDLNVYPFPKITLNNEKQEGLFIRTGYYDPNNKEVVLFVNNRHEKDVMRSLAHELIHHHQNLSNENAFNDITGTTLGGNDGLDKFESEAYEKGNMYFRKWTEAEQRKEKKTLNEEIDPKTREEKFNRRLAAEIYGTTEDFDKAGFILTTGELLDLSNGEMKKNMIHGALDVKGVHMNKFLALGEIRINADAPGIEFVQKPTEAQYNTINAFFHWVSSPVIYADCRNEEGTILWSEKYGKEDIDKFRADVNNGGPRKMPTNDVLNGYSLSDFLEEETNPEDVDLSSFNIKHNLNPKFWKDGHLDTRIRTKLLDIADDFIDYLGIPWVEPEDITMTGSLANYNWDKRFSDVDLHILIDYKDVDDKVDFVKNYFNTVKNKWNEDHGDIKIYGFSVEVYVQDVNEPHASTGVYSIDKDKWLKEPDRDKLAKSKVNKKKIREKVSDYMNRIDALFDLYSAHKDETDKLENISIAADKIFKEIKNERAKDINKGEISNGNIIFKSLRRNGYIEKISKLKKKSYNMLNSL